LITLDVRKHFLRYTSLILQAHPVEGQKGGKIPLENLKREPKAEDAAAKARQLAEKLRFRLKEAMAQRGGSEAFVHWLRSDGK
jgi:hypothetical protein